jgi:CRISPR system Cascade subunit CasD
MTEASNTVLLRLEGPLQAWGDPSKFVIRRTMEAPTKSGIIGLICCAKGLSRKEARHELPDLNRLAMGVRIDRPGTRWWDYHTVGAHVGLLTADGKIKRTASTKQIETLVSRREYLCDASFLAVLQGDPEIIGRVQIALENPRWPVYLGRKSCPPSRPVFAGVSTNEDLPSALRLQPWAPRDRRDTPPADGTLLCFVEWRPSAEAPLIPDDSEVWYDTPISFDPPVHDPRVVRRWLVGVERGAALQRPLPPRPRLRADYGNSEYQARRDQRLEADRHLCVFCKSPATTVQHVTYRRAGGDESQDDLRTLCRYCHDAVTMIEYGHGMGLDRINPEEPRWREPILEKRREIIHFRSLETRRRHLATDDGLTQEEVE